jgi:hypothetical protein
MQRIRLFGVAFLLALLAVPPVAGQVKKQGQAGFRFLENPIGAEVVGRGGVGVTMLRNTTAVFWNPAGIAWLDGSVDLGLHYTSGIADISQGAGAVGYNLGRAGVVAGSITWMDYGTFYQTYRADEEGGYVETGTFSPQAFAVGISYARAMSDRFSFGLQFKLAHQDLGAGWIQAGTDAPTLDHYSMSVPVLDVGALYDFQSHGITFGAAMQNISREVRYYDEQFPLPFAVRFSMTIDPARLAGMQIDPAHNVVFGAESWKGRDYGDRLQFGAEYSYLGAFIGRAGYMMGYSERGLTLGGGVRQHRLRVDYAYQAFGIFGNVHMLSVGTTIGQ